MGPGRGGYKTAMRFIIVLIVLAVLVWLLLSFMRSRRGRV
jgi:heme/copper-type cytochrome/quinol oxidase subunit 2